MVPSKMVPKDCPVESVLCMRIGSEYPLHVRTILENDVVVYCVSSSPFSGTKTIFTEKSFWSLFLSFCVDRILDTGSGRF